MKEKKIDRRVKYTNMVIKASVVKLLKEKPITKITVKEICDDADINRATFYSHYLDQYDLLQKIEDELIDDIVSYLSRYEFNDINMVSVEAIARILRYIEENSDLFDLLLNSNNDMSFQQEVIKIIGKQPFMQMLGESLNNEDKEYIFHFLASGAVGIIQKWLREGLKKSKDEIADLILNLSLHGRSSFSK